jgi:alkyl hydroperoxide reductase subunit AhpC
MIRLDLDRYIFEEMTLRAASAIIGKTAPFFKAQSWSCSGKDFKELSLDDYKSKWLVLFFYPLDFTFVCPTEIVEFSNHAKSFRQHNCEIVGCSIDSQFVHRRWCLESRKDGGLGDIDIPLLADVKKEIAADYGVLNEGGVALRGTFIIDDKQILRHTSVNDLGVGRNVEEYLRLVQAFQYNAKHGEVCPAGWTKGKPTMNPKNEKELKGYWENVHGKK